MQAGSRKITTEDEPAKGESDEGPSGPVSQNQIINEQAKVEAAQTAAADAKAIQKAQKEIEAEIAKKAQEEATEKARREEETTQAQREQAEKRLRLQYKPRLPISSNPLWKSHSLIQ